MRLINTRQLKFKDFHGELPHYAILSHCWGDDEVTYQQFLAASEADRQRGEGWRKIRKCCELALRFGQGLEWAWVDTCCIDKTSTAELSEAINSMFAWYEESVVCFVLLPEEVEGYASESVLSEPFPTTTTIRRHAGSHVNTSFMGATPMTAIEHILAQSRWCTRGWTLQELLAPKVVFFFDRLGRELGSRTNLSQILANATGIGVHYLTGTSCICSASIACRMSWAAKRQTTRGEDIAYCLLGLFSINMPLLYGEGSKGAFRRLQESIIGQSDDQTILAWTRRGDIDAPPSRSSILAQHPSDFSECAFLVPQQLATPPTRITSRGVELFIANESVQDLFSGNARISPSMRTYSSILRLPLACYDSRKVDNPQQVVEIKLKRDEVMFTGVEQYYRIATDQNFRSNVPFWVGFAKPLLSFGMRPTFGSIYAQRLDTKRDDSPRASLPGNPDPDEADSDNPALSWIENDGTFRMLGMKGDDLGISVGLTLAAGIWIARFDQKTLIPLALLAMKLYLQRGQMAPLFFFIESSHMSRAETWVLPITASLQLLYSIVFGIRPSWWPHQLPAFWVLWLPHPVVTRFFATVSPDRSTNIIRVVCILVFVLAMSYVSTSNEWGITTGLIVISALRR